MNRVTDFYGSTRVIGAACDIGSHELAPPGGTLVLIL